MIKNPIVFFGSSRSDGNTIRAVNAVIDSLPISVIDLADFNISYYDYENKNKDDDFIPLAERMVNHEKIILATPVYWYTMSAIMKTFIDRWTNLIEIRKDLGRKLEKKELYIITSLGSEVLPKGFEDPFIQTCDYMKMVYKGCLYYFSGTCNERIKLNEPLIDNFRSNLLS